MDTTTVHPLYERVADRVADLIRNGALGPGDRLPSVRRLSGQQGISITTTMEAYRLLEDRGLIEARPQSGFYVRVPANALPAPRVSRPPQVSTVVGIGELVQKVHTAMRQPGIVPLGAACPAPELLPIEKLNRAMHGVLRRAPREAHSLAHPPGCEALRRQIARRSLDQGCALDPDEILVTCGALEAVNLCLRAVAKPGDTIALESPTYFGLLQAIESLGMRALEIPTDPETGLQLEALERAMERKRVHACALVPTFQNPLGYSMPEERKKALVELCTRHQVPIIEDDLNGDLFFGAKRPRTCKAFDTSGIVLLCSSFSKTLSPGYRVGWVAAGAALRDPIERLKLVTTLATTAVTQITIATFLEEGGYDHHLRTMRRTLATQAQRFRQAIVESFPAGTRVSRPEGGLTLWIELPSAVDALELNRRALARNISIAPGPIFSARSLYRNCVRLTYAQPWSARIEAAIHTIGQLATELCC